MFGLSASERRRKFVNERFGKATKGKTASQKGQALSTLWKMAYRRYPNK